MYLKNFSLEFLSKDRVMFSTICLSLSLLILVSQTLTCNASNPAEQDEEKEGKKHTALSRWELPPLSPNSYKTINFAPGVAAFGFTAKFLKSYIDEAYAQQLAKREAQKRKMSEIDALNAYRKESITEAWKGNPELQKLLQTLKDNYTILIDVVPILLAQHAEMRTHIVEMEKAQERSNGSVAPAEESALAELRSQLSAQEEELSRVRQIVIQVSEEKEAKDRKIKALEAELAAKQEAAKAKELEEKRVEIARLTAEAEAQKLTSQLASANAQVASQALRIAELERSLAAQAAPKSSKSVSGNRDQDGEVQKLRAEVLFYKERMSWMSWFLDWVWGRKPNVYDDRDRGEKLL